MGIQPSASRTGLLLECTRPFAEDTTIEPEPSREPARYGSAFHLVLAAMLRSKKPLPPAVYTREVDTAVKLYDVRHTAHELAGHVRSSHKVLMNWLTRQKLKIIEIEKAYAVNPVRWLEGAKNAVRQIPSHDEEHHYDVKPGELPGTVDMIVGNDQVEMPLDHKTGFEDTDFAQPSKVPQMRTLGLIVQAKRERNVAIFHADRRGLPIVYAEEYYDSDATKHAKALAAAFARIGDGFLRPGPHCGRCPAQDDCPARSADLLSESTAALVKAASVLADEPVDPRKSLAPMGNSTIESRAAALYTLLKRFRALEKAGSEEIRRLVEDGKVVETVEGVLEMSVQSFESLSKKSLMAALGKIKGERELKKLRELGALSTTTRKVIMPRGD